MQAAVAGVRPGCLSLSAAAGMADIFACFYWFVSPLPVSAGGNSSGAYVDWWQLALMLPPLLLHRRPLVLMAQ